MCKFYRMITKKLPISINNPGKAIQVFQKITGIHGKFLYGQKIVHSFNKSLKKNLKKCEFCQIFMVKIMNFMKQLPKKMFQYLYNQLIDINYSYGFGT